jgi:hypothetical protein
MIKILAPRPSEAIALEAEFRAAVDHFMQRPNKTRAAKVFKFLRWDNSALHNLSDEEVELLNPYLLNY